MSSPAAPGTDDGPSTWTRIVRLHAVRAVLHYAGNRGAVLAGGIAYIGLFSLASLLVTGVSVLVLVFRADEGLQERVYGALNDQIPGLVDTGDGGAVDPQVLLQQADLASVTGVAGLLLALVAGLGWLNALREGIRAIFVVEPDPTFVVRKKVKDLFVLVTLGLAILASAVLSVGVNAAARSVLQALGLGGGPVQQLLIQALGVLLALALDTAIFLLLFRVLSGLDVPWRHLRGGALVGGIGLGVLKLTGGVLLSRLGSDNALLASSAVIAGLLIWLNLLARVTLVAASWAATSAEEAGSVVLRRHVEGAREDLPVPAGPRVRTAASFGQRSTDRVALGAGAVLGALAVVGLRVGGGAVRSVVDAARGGRDR